MEGSSTRSVSKPWLQWALMPPLFSWLINSHQEGAWVPLLTSLRHMGASRNIELIESWLVQKLLLATKSSLLSECGLPLPHPWVTMAIMPQRSFRWDSRKVQSPCLKVRLIGTIPALCLHVSGIRSKPILFLPFFLFLLCFSWEHSNKTPEKQFPSQALVLWILAKDTSYLFCLWSLS